MTSEVARVDLASAHTDRYLNPHLHIVGGGDICSVTSEVAEGRSSLGPP